MEKKKSYFVLQLKRMFKTFPVVFIITVAMAVCMGGLTYLYMKNGIFSEEQQKYHIGIVGDISDSFLGFGVYAVESLDDSRFMIEFENLTKKEAETKLRQGEITAYVCVPDGLVESLVRGENDKKITFVTSQGQKGITSILMEELSDIASTLITRSQSAVYGMQTISWNNGMGDTLIDNENELCLQYIAMILKRTRLCEVEDIGVANDLSISVEEFYFCSLLLFFILLLGINSSYLFSHRNNELSKFMAARKIGAVKQTVSEYFSYVCLLSTCILGIFVLISIIFEGQVIGFFVRIIPVIAMFAAMQFLIYEFVSGIVSSILLQFICSVSMAYVSGYFYPERFFPESVKRIGELLPTGVALKYADASITGHFTVGSFAGIVVYGILFLGLSIIIRKHKIQRG